MKEATNHRGEVADVVPGERISPGGRTTVPVVENVDCVEQSEAHRNSFADRDADTAGSSTDGAWPAGVRIDTMTSCPSNPANSRVVPVPARRLDGADTGASELTRIAGQ